MPSVQRYPELAQFIEEELTRRKIPVATAARYAGCTRTFLAGFLAQRLGPPGEAKLRKICELTEHSIDEVMAMRGAVCRDVIDIILRHPEEFTALVRAARDLNPDELVYMTEALEKRNGQ